MLLAKRFRRKGKKGGVREIARKRAQIRFSALQRQDLGDHLSVLVDTEFAKAAAGVKISRHRVRRYVVDDNPLHMQVLADFRERQFHRLAPEALRLMMLVNHEAIEGIVVRSAALGMALPHDEADGALAGIDGAQHGIEVEFGFGDRPGIILDELLLSLIDLKAGHLLPIVGGDLAQSDIFGDGPALAVS